MADETDLRRHKDAKQERHAGCVRCLPRSLRFLTKLYSPYAKEYFKAEQAVGATRRAGQVFSWPAGRWVKKAESAFNFPNLLSVITTCLSRRLKDVELVLRYADETPEQRFPLDAIQ